MVRRSQLQFALGGRCPWYAVVQVPVPQLQFINVVVYTPVVAQSLSHGPDSSSDHSASTVAGHGVRSPCCTGRAGLCRVQRQIPMVLLFSRP